MKPTPLLAALVLASALSAQGAVWTVDDDGGADFTVIQDAVDVAADGDVIVVRDGVYGAGARNGAIVIDGMAVTVRAESGHAPEILGQIRVLHIAAAQSVELRGLTVPMVASVEPLGSPRHALDVSACRGSVSVIDCSLHGGGVAGFFPTGTGANLDRAREVTFHRTTLRGRDGAGLIAIDSGVALHECHVEGDGPVFLQGNPGVLVLGGFLLVRGGSIRGAAGENSGLVFNPFSMEFTCTSAHDGGPGLWLARDLSPLPYGPAASLPLALVGGAEVAGGVGGTGALHCPDAAGGPPFLIDEGLLEFDRRWLLLTSLFETPSTAGAPTFP